jgi:D-alanyl-D-alanine carboxypeptidase
MPMRPSFALVTALILFACLIMTADEALARRYSAVIVDMQDGTVLHAENIDRRVYPASLTKIMTLYLTFDALKKRRLSLTTPLKISRRAAGQTPSRLGLKRGRTITVRSAIRAVVTKSANDAATVLAEALAGNEVDFAVRMTKTARSLGMIRTTFRNATGLPNRRQRTTARDMAKLAVALVRNFPEYYHFFSTRSFKWGKRTHRNTNGLLTSYRGADGIKTGYIRASGFNLVASVHRGKTRLVGVIFGGRSPKMRNRRMTTLLNRGFTRLAAQRKADGRYGGLRRVPRLSPPAPRARPHGDGVLVQKVEDHSTPKPSRSPMSTQWGIQVGAFSTLAQAQKAGYRAAATSKRLDPRKVYFVRGLLGDGLVYRARLAGLTQAKASAACKELFRRKLACAVVRPNGDVSARLAHN